MSRAERRLPAVVVAGALLAGACQIVAGIDGREVTAHDAGLGADASSPPAAAADGAADAGPSCRIGEERCGATCVDVRTSPDHCGECGHSCLGAECRNGECVPEPWIPGALGSVEPGSVWVAGDELLYRPLPDDPNRVPNPSSPLLGKNRSSGAVRTILEVGRYVAMVPAGGSTFVLLDHAPGARVRKVDVQTGAASTLYQQATTEPSFRGAVVDGSDVYWTTRNDVRHVKLDGSGYEVVYTPPAGKNVAHGIATTATSLYFGMGESSDGELRAIGRAPGSTPRAVDFGAGGAAYVTVRQDTVLWTSGAQLREVPLPAEAPATPRAIGTADARLAVERDGMLWIVDPVYGVAKPHQSRVVRYDPSTHRARVVVSGLAPMSQIAVDERYLYLPLYDEGVWRVAR